jgi:hypothetical protein
MISKRRKTATLWKNQRKCSNRGRRLHRMKMRGGVFPNDNILLSQFKHTQTHTHFPKSSCYITPATLQKRIEYLQKYKAALDELLNKGKDNETHYTHDLFKEGVLDRINENIHIFQKYSPNPYNDQSFDYVRPGFILPILNEYLAAGFTPEELLRAELDDITITAILNEIVPAIDTSTILTNKRQSKSMRAKISVYGYNKEFLLSANIPKAVLDEEELWTEKYTDLLKQKITETMLTTLISANISTAEQLIKLGFSRSDLENNNIPYKLSELKSVSINRLVEGGFTLQEIKTAEFTVKDFRESGYNLKQLIELGFMKNDFQPFTNITFTSSEFPENNTLTADIFKRAGFKCEDVYKLKYDTYTQIKSISKEIDAAHINTIIENVFIYLKSIGFTVQEFMNAFTQGTDKENTNIAVQNLILAGFDYTQINSFIENNKIYMAIKSLVPDIISHCSSLRLTYTDLREIGFFPMDIAIMNYGKVYPIKYTTTNELQAYKNAKFTPTDFQMESFIDSQPMYKKVPMEYTKKFSAFHLKEAGFSLEELILTKEQNEQNEQNSNERRLGYDLKDLMCEYTDEFINPKEVNIVDIFESGFYTYGEIRKVLETYEKKGDWYEKDLSIKRRVDRLTNREQNLSQVRDNLTKLKNKRIIVDGEKKSMCERKWGLGFFGSNGTTDDNCKYKPYAKFVPLN